MRVGWAQDKTGKKYFAELSDNAVEWLARYGNRQAFCVTRHQHKLILGTAAAAADLELYDYVKDPLETKNVASDQPEVVARMRALLAKLPEARPQFRAARPQQN